MKVYVIMVGDVLRSPACAVTADQDKAKRLASHIRTSCKCPVEIEEHDTDAIDMLLNKDQYLVTFDEDGSVESVKKQKDGMIDYSTRTDLACVRYNDEIIASVWADSVTEAIRGACEQCARHLAERGDKQHEDH